MKSTYPGFYSTPDETLREIWGAESTLFVFDTNCLLNLYRCEDHTREEILNVMRALAPRTWIPFQIGYEYQKNRRKVIEESISSLSKIQLELQKSYKQNILSQGSIKKHLNTALSQEVSDLQESIKKLVESYIDSKIKPRINRKNEISNHDSIRDDIDSIINQNVGSLPTQEQINNINDEGETRYKNNIPPGFNDETKTDINHFSGIEFKAKFGDLYLWKEIISKATEGNIHSVIFVCDDNKNDWWYEYAGKTHGPLEALTTEICNHSAIDNFKLMNHSTFLQYAKKYLGNVTVSESSLKEVEVLSNSTANDEYIINKDDEKGFHSKFSDYYHGAMMMKDLVTHKNSSHILPSESISDLIESNLTKFESIESLSHRNYNKLDKLKVNDNETVLIEKASFLRDKLVAQMIQAKGIVDYLEKFRTESDCETDITNIISQLSRFELLCKSINTTNLQITVFLNNFK